MRIREVMWSRPTWQGLLEGWLVSVLMLSATMPILRDAPGLVISMLFLLVTGVCSGWAGARIKLRPGVNRRVFLYEILLALALMAGHFTVVVGLMWMSASFDVPIRSHLGEAVTYFSMLLCIPAFLATRASGYFMRFWNRLRGSRYVWALTHSLLSAIALTGALIIFIGVLFLAFQTGMDLTNIPADRLFSTLVIWTFTFFFMVLAAGLGFLVIFSLPSFAFSYWTARRMTRRIESLSSAAEKLRSGDLSVRVAIEGQDEMAALQTSFNAMAENLQRSTQAIQAERDTVAGLLKIQRELTAGVSHELRTPAAAILAHSESLMLEPASGMPAFMRGDLEVIVHEAGRLQSILTELLTLSQTQAGRISLRLLPVAAGEAIQRVLQNLAPLAWNQKRIQITADLHPGLRPALADPVKLEQILINLIQNGTRHTPPGGVVVVSAWSEADYSWFEIADTGEGIPEHLREHIWEPFYRVQGTDETSSGDGFGLGLSLVKSMVEAMGGTVDVESHPGEGSAFRVRLPAT